jgi:hypothetical protein
MAIASPYAVFRAVDVGWPPPALTVSPPPSLEPAQRPRPRRRKRAQGPLSVGMGHGPSWQRVVQGELFQQLG